MKYLYYHNNVLSLFRNRHWHIIKRHISARKIANLVHGYCQFLGKRAMVSSFPVYVKIETTDRCHLKCPGCHDDSTQRKNKNLDFDSYTRLIDQLSKYLLEVSLFDQGEPLIDPRIAEFIEYASRQNIGTVISTNFSIPYSEQKMIRLIESGLDYLQVAVDGVTQETYEQYRVGGQLDLVLGNLALLISLKKKLQSPTPLIEWQMIDFDFNKGEQQKAETLAWEMGVDSFVLKPDGRCGHSTGGYSRNSACGLLWFSLAVECDGIVSACLINDDDTLMVGDINRDNIADIWNSDAYQQLREGVSRRSSENHLYCQRCNWFDQTSKS